MRGILQKRPLRFVFAANIISMIGSGMNSAAVIWYVLQATGSEVALGWLLVLQTVPAMLLMPFAGVIIDREDRRRIVMLLDGARGLVILTVAVLALRGAVHLWHVYLMNVLVATGFWMFWPSVTALIQELTPESEYLHSNAFLMAGVQGGWLIAGSIVGFVYNHIGLGGVLLIDAATYAISLSLYFAVRKGRHVVAPEHGEAPASSLRHFIRDIHDGLLFLRGNRYVVLIGLCAAFFLGAMLSQAVVTAPLSDRILRTGAEGYGWLNASWGVGAFICVFNAPRLVRVFGPRGAIAVCMAVLASGMYAAPHSRWLFMAVPIYVGMGAARGMVGVAINSELMEFVPKHYMGRVQNTFNFAGMVLQMGLAVFVGLVAHRIGLVWAFAMIGFVYTLAFVAAMVPAPRVAAAEGTAAD